MRILAQKRLEEINRILESTSNKNDSFLGGSLGLAYYYFNFYKATEDAGFKDRGEALLESVFANLNAGYPKLIGASFSTGGAGLGYVVHSLLRDGLISIDFGETFSELDKFLFNTASAQIDDDVIDYLHGALGVVHYFSQQKSSPQVDFYLDTLVGKICERAVKGEGGYWFRNHVLRVEEKENINFSLSHGLSGVLLILLNAYERSGHKDLIRKVVLEGIRFLRKYKMDVDFSNDEYSLFPFIVKEVAREISAPNRLGWCYGDLNEVLLFYKAGRLFQENDLVELADVLGGQTVMRRTEKATMVTGSCFCHGSAGLSQFYRKLYQETNLEVYKEAYEYWVEMTLLFLETELRDDTFKGKELEMLEGLTGIAFSLLSFVADNELTWSRSLLL